MPSEKEKSSEFYCRGPRIWRLGYRVMRAHNGTNLKKTAWLLGAIVEKLKREEPNLPPDPSLPPLPDKVTNDHIEQ